MNNILQNLEQMNLLSIGLILFCVVSYVITLTRRLSPDRALYRVFNFISNWRCSCGLSTVRVTDFIWVIALIFGASKSLTLVSKQQALSYDKKGDETMEQKFQRDRVKWVYERQMYIWFTLSVIWL